MNEGPVALLKPSESATLPRKPDAMKAAPDKSTLLWFNGGECLEGDGEGEVCELGAV